MFLKKCKYKNGRTFLSIVNGYKINGTTKHEVIKKIGYLDELQKKYDDPIDFFSKQAKQLEKEFLDSPTIENLKNKKLVKEKSDRKNVGYLFIKLLYEELGINKFLKEKQLDLDINFNLNEIFSLLIFSRILYPGSKKENFENKEIFFKAFNNFELYDIYRSLDYFNSYKDEIELLLWNSTKEKYNRDASRSYYDCTNYYFEINYNNEDLVDEEGNIIEKGYCKRGPEKNHRPDPIIEMGLLMDASDIPMAYDIFPGNESEKLSMLPIVKRVKAKFNINRTIVVADRGLNTSDNIFYLAGRNNKQLDGYIYGQSVRGADKEFKEWVLNQEGYINDPIHDKDGKPEMFRQMKFDKDGKCIGYEKKQEYFKHKSRIYPKELTIKRDGKRKVKVRTDQKQLVYYSQKYADKQKRDRNQMIERAKDIIANPKKYDKVSCKGAKSYINNIKFVKSSGEIADGIEMSLKEDLIKEEEKYDGYYSIVTSELNMSDFELRNKYRGLTKIEDTFKVTKSELETRPVYVWTKDHIESHFLTCFVALVIVRLLEKKTDNKYSASKIINSLKKCECNKLNNITNLFDYYDDIIEDLDKVFNVDLSDSLISTKKLKKFFNI